MRLVRLGHVNLAVADLAAARDFYERLLGLPPAPRPADAGVRPGLWFRLDEDEIEVHISEEPGADAAASRRHVAFEVDDLDDARARFAAAGVAIEEGRPLPGVRRFFVRDPSGNRFELFSVD